MNIFGRLANVFHILEYQGFDIAPLFKKGFSVSSTRLLHGIKYYCHNIMTVIDVGANIGQFTLASKRVFPQAKIISFEPLAEQYAQYTSNTNGLEGIVSYNIALGESNGTIDFYSNKHSHASSILKISQEQMKAIPETQNSSLIRVDIKRLDDVVSPEDITSPSLLKLDVQGYEKQVMEGGKEILPFIDYLIFEGSFVSMYENEPSFDEMHSYIKSKGFMLVAPVGFLFGRAGEILQADFLYRRHR